MREGQGRATTGARKDAKRGDDVLEPIEPGGEVGETREVGAGGSGLRQPGRPPRTRAEIRGPED